MWVLAHVSRVEGPHTYVEGKGREQMVALAEKNLPSKWYWLENESCRCLREHERIGGASKVVSGVANPPDTPNEITTNIGPRTAHQCQN